MKKLLAATKKQFFRLERWLEKLFMITIRNKLRYKIKPALTLTRLLLIFALAATVYLLIADINAITEARLPLDGPSFFYTAGGMIGAMLAIVFAFSSQLVGKVNDTIPTRYYNIFSKDKLLEFYFLVIALITLSLFGLGIVFQDQGGEYRFYFFRVAFTLIIWAVILLFFAYRRLVKLMSIDFIALKLVKAQKAEIDEINKLAKKLARLNSRGHGLNDGEKKQILAGSYAALDAHIKHLRQNIEGLYELHVYFVKRNDIYAANLFLHAAFSMMDGYIYSRRNSSMLIPNPEFPISPESSLSDFLQQSIETLTPALTNALKENNVPTIKSFLDGMQGLVRVTLMVEHVGGSVNPAYDSAYYNLRSLAELIIESKNADALFHVAHVYQQIADLALTKDYYGDVLYSILDDMYKLCEATLVDKKFSSANYNAMKKIFQVVSRAVSEDRIDETRIRKLKEVLPKAIVLTTFLSNNPVTDTAIASFGDNLLPVALHNHNTPPDKSYVDKFIVVSELLIEVMEKLFPLTTGNKHQVQNFNRAVTTIAHDSARMFNEVTLSDRQNDSMRWIWNRMANLNKKFKPTPELVSLNDINDLIDHQIQAALHALQFEQAGLAEMMFDSITDKLQQIIKTKSPKLKVQEALVYSNRSKAIGALARKLKRRKLQAHVAGRIKETEQIFIDNYHSKKPSDAAKNQYLFPNILREDHRYIIHSNPRGGLPDYFADSQAVFFKLADTDDLLKFEEYLWR